MMDIIIGTCQEKEKTKRWRRRRVIDSLQWCQWNGVE